MRKIPKSETPVNLYAIEKPQTWCECCGNTTTNRQLACKLECAEWLVEDAISRGVPTDVLHKYQLRRDRWRTRGGLLRLGRGKRALRHAQRPEARA